MVPRIVVTRGKWNAVAPRFTEPLELPVNKIILYHTNLPTCRNMSTCVKLLQEMQSLDMDARLFSDIAYNYMIGDDGIIYEGRGWLVANENLDPDETGMSKTTSFHVGLLSDFKEEVPPQPIKEAIEDLIQYGLDHNYISQSYTTKTVYMGTDKFKAMETNLTH